jgi:proteic killer suppression protein
MAITGCKDKRTQRFLAGERVREFQGIADRAARSLTKLQAAVILGDLRHPPSNKFKALGADRLGQYSIWINDQWRVCFKWAPHPTNPEGTDILLTTGDCYDVEIVDYH